MNNKERIKLTYEHEARCDCKAIKELRKYLKKLAIIIILVNPAIIEAIL